MKRIVFFIAAALFIGGIVNAQDRTSLFTLLSDTPVISHGATSWEQNYNYTDPGAVIYYDGMFHIFRNAFHGWPAAVEIDYLTSPDAIAWTEMSDKPVLSTSDVPFAKKAALASSVIVEDDGTWVLYFYTWNTSNGASGKSEIGRATASNPLGPWTIDPEPVLKPGSSGTWDEDSVDGPAVRKTDKGYVMYYAGYGKTRSASGKIGMATSEDGIVWTKYDDPATTSVPLAESDPIVVADTTWEGRFVNQPRVEHTADGWVMLYRASGASPSKDMAIGLATSEDGISWTKYAANPVFAPADAGQSTMWYTSTTYNDGTYYLFAEMAPSAGTDVTDIFSMAYQGSLPPEN